MQIVPERQQQCPAFRHVKVCPELAATRLPDNGVPEHITACATQVSGAERAPMRLDGPASKAPELGKADAGETASEDSNSEESDDNEQKASLATGAEACIAVDSVHDIKPVKAFNALKAQLEIVACYKGIS